MNSIKEITDKLREKLKEAVERNYAEGILFSGGLDTSILAFILSIISSGVKAFNVRLKGYEEDLKYAGILSCQLNNINYSYSGFLKEKVTIRRHKE